VGLAEAYDSLTRHCSSSGHTGAAGGHTAGAPDSTLHGLLVEALATTERATRKSVELRAVVVCLSPAAQAVLLVLGAAVLWLLRQAVHPCTGVTHPSKKNN